MEQKKGQGNVDSGLAALVIISELRQISVQPEQLKHRFGRGTNQFSREDVLQAAKFLGFSTKSVSISDGIPDHRLFPAIGQTNDGEFFVVAKIKKSISDESSLSDEMLLQFPGSGKIETLSYEKYLEVYSDQLIILKHTKAGIENTHSTFNISWFWQSLKKYRKLFYEVLIASFFLQLFALVTPLFFQVVMDKVLVHRGFTTLDVLAVGFFVVVVFEAFLGGFRNYLFSHTTNRVDVELGSRLYHHLLRLPLSYFESRQVGQNVARVRELDSIRNFLTGTALTLLIDCLFLIVFIGIMWLYSPTLTWVVLATIPAYAILSILITPTLRSRLEEKFQHGAANTAFLTESITGMETVKSQALEPQMQRNLEDHLSRYVGASFKSENINNIANQVAGLVNKLMVLGIIWLGAHLVVEGSLTVGQLVAFNMLAGRVSGPILKLVQLWQEFQQAGISLARLGDILNTPAEQGFDHNQTQLTALKGKVEIDSVYFRYRPQTPLILENFSLTIEPGKTIGFVGRSGCGKSTLAKLIQRLYVPETGRVLIDDVDVSLLDQAWLRRQIGVVSQDNFLFNRTIRDNIALSDPSVPLEDVIQAAKDAGAHEFITAFPDAYNTLVGEQGSNLSGGQRQRIAIARALLSNPKILILDEATSALDYESEQLIQKNLKRICEGRTVIIIAHRLKTLQECDHICVLSEGVITEQGSHSQLMALKGYYSKLIRMQNSPNGTESGTITIQRRPKQHSSVEVDC